LFSSKELAFKTNSFDEKFFRYNPNDYAEEATPVPIPNTAVKLLKVDGTDLARDWESRTSLGLI
jgi:hypothetical protein